jgi:phage-related protein
LQAECIDKYIVYDIFKAGAVKSCMAYKISIYQDKSGKEPIVEFLNSLPVKHRAKAIRTIDLLAEFGRDLKAPYTKHLEKELWELRVKHGSDISRIFYFAEIGGSFVLLHGFVKKSQKTPKKELERAQRYLDDYCRRFGK